MITLSTDHSICCAEEQYEHETMRMMFMALAAADLSCADLNQYTSNANKAIHAITEFEDENAGAGFIQANDELLNLAGISVINKKRLPEEGHYPLIITSVYNDWGNFSLICEIHRGFVAETREEFDLYQDNQMGYVGDGELPTRGEIMDRQNAELGQLVTDSVKEFGENYSKRNLCDYCVHDFPSCPASVTDVTFGDGIGNDNVMECKSYEEQPDTEATNGS